MKYYSTEYIPVIEQLLYDWVFEIEYSKPSVFMVIRSNASKRERQQEQFSNQRLTVYWENYRYWKNQKLNSRQKVWLNNIKSHLSQLNQLLVV